MQVFIKNFALSALSGVLFALPWLSPYCLPFIFIAFVPLFILENNLKENKWHKSQLFFYLFISFFTWNILSCWWIMIASLHAALFYFFENAVFMSSAFLIFHVLANYIRKSTIADSLKITKQTLIYFTFALSWLTFEFIHFNWSFSWPWITLGNALSFFTPLVQWYEYTGVLGGSLWILLINVFVFDIYLHFPFASFYKKRIVNALYLLMPAIASFIIYFTYTEKGTNTEVVIVQPNIDPYEEKFPYGKKFIPYDKQIDLFFQLAEEKITPDTRYVLLPETAYPVRWELKNLEKIKDLDKFYSFRTKHENLSLIMGIETFQRYNSKEEITSTTRYSKNAGYFDYYNSAIQLNSLDKTPISHKSKHLHWAEAIPLRSLLHFIEPLTIYLGGFGSHGFQKERTIFNDAYSNKVGTAICYESVYGSFVSEFVKKGAQAIFIITNDGWWKDSPGYKQHLAFDRLRAIENRKSVARCSNNGISCIINQKGDLDVKSGFETRESIRGNLKLNKQKTLYIVLGDWIGKTASALIILLISYILVDKFRKGKKI